MNTITDSRTGDAGAGDAHHSQSAAIGSNGAAEASSTRTDGAPADEPTRGGIPREWMGRPFLNSRGIDRVKIFGQPLSASDPTAITWHIRKGATHYGIGTYHSSFADRGHELSFGRRIPTAEEIDAALYLARHRIDHGAWTGPLQINGSDKYKGAVLARAVTLDIPLGNPELLTLQDILRRQHGLASTSERVNTLYGSGQPTVQRAAAQTPSPTVAAAEPVDARLHHDEPVRPISNGVSRDNALLPDLLRLLSIDYDSAEIDAATKPPTTHSPNEVQTYAVVVANDTDLGISFGDGTYMIVPRTNFTCDVGAGSLVMVRTDKDGNIRAIAPYTDQTRITVPRARTQDDPEVVFRNAAPPEVSGFAAEIALSMLEGDARAALAAENIPTRRMKHVPYNTPTKNTTLTVLARNEAGFALKVNNFGHFTLVDHGKVPLPDVPAGSQIAFRSVDGVMRAMDAVAAKHIDAAKTTRAVSI